MNIPPLDPNSKRIRTREAMIRYKQALQNKEAWQGEMPLGEGPLNRDGMPKVPPGQKSTERWPVLDLGVQPEIPLASWSLTVSGLVENPATFDWGQFMAFPQVEDVSDFHCVTTWSRLDNHWAGVRFSDIANHCRPKPEARFVYIKAYDAYSTNLPLVEAMKYDVLLVHQWEGKPLTKEHGGPVRMITPQLYAWKGAKWIGEIEFREQDELGFWEQRGYSNSADPWLEERYSR
ncbi:MAG: molybdopterin-dependent oxidoreductase [Nitrospinaceae bacterium]|nr:sulfite oxidase-like oxidoreductase [Nitrospinaceae bacterium]NIR56685.1 sulfite oxidase-like oxidoreductase [Nitrospinaceae bacterium]NIT84002.1 sulfite oxidase-like oxidoreductase [Nitrospinaceae bacterium]NIU46194.1 sulfite oxidase-like oxidoreductase [Nitrospinaceae bacterium]NIU98371.1 molybdopterin-dependent oxidoreductase [Nitrospinaceae bacterium]